ncbi:hypothetical protein [Streptomyces resistomycificus]|uniref:hypothetical protein n=1 Tax=Streptomyces resistomycificus TaxID=67356 RepID=UPI000FE1F9A6|nr:hypothetical protein [Streptomyces resistomycificus]
MYKRQVVRLLLRDGRSGTRLDQHRGHRAGRHPAGSADGPTWQTLDERPGEAFAWDRQTRAFTVRSPGTYEKYRLAVDGEAALSEVELLS